jgi:hypothetical protein
MVDSPDCEGIHDVVRESEEKTMTLPEDKPGTPLAIKEPSVALETVLAELKDMHKEIKAIKQTVDSIAQKVAKT